MFPDANLQQELSSVQMSARFFLHHFKTGDIKRLLLRSEDGVLRHRVNPRMLDVRPVTSDVAGMLSLIKNNKINGGIMQDGGQNSQVLYIFKEQFSAIHQPAATATDSLLFFSVILIKMSQTAAQTLAAHIASSHQV